MIIRSHAGGGGGWTPPSNPWTFRWVNDTGVPAYGTELINDYASTELFPVLNGVKLICESNWMHVRLYDANKNRIIDYKFLSSYSIAAGDAVYFAISCHLNGGTSGKKITITWL